MFPYGLLLWLLLSYIWFTRCEMQLHSLEQVNAARQNLDCGKIVLDEKDDLQKIADEVAKKALVSKTHDAFGIIYNVQYFKTIAASVQLISQRESQPQPTKPQAADEIICKFVDTANCHRVKTLLSETVNMPYYSPNKFVKIAGTLLGYDYSQLMDPETHSLVVGSAEGSEGILIIILYIKHYSSPLLDSAIIQINSVREKWLEEALDDWTGRSNPVLNMLATDFAYYVLNWSFAEDGNDAQAENGEEPSGVGYGGLQPGAIHACSFLEILAPYEPSSAFDLLLKQIFAQYSLQSLEEFVMPRKLNQLEPSSFSFLDISLILTSNKIGFAVVKNEKSLVIAIVYETTLWKPYPTLKGFIMKIREKWSQSPELSLDTEFKAQNVAWQLAESIETKDSCGTVVCPKFVTFWSTFDSKSKSKEDMLINFLAKSLDLAKNKETDIVGNEANDGLENSRILEKEIQFRENQIRTETIIQLIAADIVTVGCAIVQRKENVKVVALTFETTYSLFVKPAIDLVQLLRHNFDKHLPLLDHVKCSELSETAGYLIESIPEIENNNRVWFLASAKYTATIWVYHIEDSEIFSIALVHRYFLEIQTGLLLDQSQLKDDDDTELLHKEEGHSDLDCLYSTDHITSTSYSVLVKEAVDAFGFSYAYNKNNRKLKIIFLSPYNYFDRVALCHAFNTKYTELNTQAKTKTNETELHTGPVRQIVAQESMPQDNNTELNSSAVLSILSRINPNSLNVPVGCEYIALLLKGKKTAPSGFGITWNRRISWAFFRYNKRNSETLTLQEKISRMCESLDVIWTSASKGALEGLNEVLLELDSESIIIQDHNYFAKTQVFGKKLNSMDITVTDTGLETIVVLAFFIDAIPKVYRQARSRVSELNQFSMSTSPLNRIMDYCATKLASTVLRRTDLDGVSIVGFGTGVGYDAHVSIISKNVENAVDFDHNKIESILCQLLDKSRDRSFEWDTTLNFGIPEKVEGFSKFEANSGANANQVSIANAVGFGFAQNEKNCVAVLLYYKRPYSTEVIRSIRNSYWEVTEEVFVKEEDESITAFLQTIANSGGDSREVGFGFIDTKTCVSFEVHPKKSFPLDKDNDSKVTVLTQLMDKIRDTSITEFKGNFDPFKIIQFKSGGKIKFFSKILANFSVADLSQVVNANRFKMIVYESPTHFSAAICSPINNVDIMNLPFTAINLLRNNAKAPPVQIVQLDALIQMPLQIALLKNHHNIESQNNVHWIQQSANKNSFIDQSIHVCVNQFELLQKAYKGFKDPTGIGKVYFGQSKNTHHFFYQSWPWSIFYEMQKQLKHKTKLINCPDLTTLAQTFLEQKYDKNKETTQQNYNIDSCYGVVGTYAISLYDVPSSDNSLPLEKIISNFLKSAKATSRTVLRDATEIDGFTKIYDGITQQEFDQLTVDEEVTVGIAAIDYGETLKFGIMYRKIYDGGLNPRTLRSLSSKFAFEDNLSYWLSSIKRKLRDVVELRVCPRLSDLASNFLKRNVISESCFGLVIRATGNSDSILPRPMTIYKVPVTDYEALPVDGIVSNYFIKLYSNAIPETVSIEEATAADGFYKFYNHVSQQDFKQLKISGEVGVSIIEFKGTVLLGIMYNDISMDTLPVVNVQQIWKMPRFEDNMTYWLEALTRTLNEFRKVHYNSTKEANLTLFEDVEAEKIVLNTHIFDESCFGVTESSVVTVYKVPEEDYASFPVEKILENFLNLAHKTPRESFVQEVCVENYKFRKIYHGTTAMDLMQLNSCDKLAIGIVIVPIKNTILFAIVYKHLLVTQALEPIMREYFLKNPFSSSESPDVTEDVFKDLLALKNLNFGELGLISGDEINATVKMVPMKSLSFIGIFEAFQELIASIENFENSISTDGGFSTFPYIGTGKSGTRWLTVADKNLNKHQQMLKMKIFREAKYKYDDGNLVLMLCYNAIKLGQSKDMFVQQILRSWKLAEDSGGKSSNRRDKTELVPDCKLHSMAHGLANVLKDNVSELKMGFLVMGEHLAVFGTTKYENRDSEAVYVDLFITQILNDTNPIAILLGSSLRSLLLSGSIDALYRFLKCRKTESFGFSLSGMVNKVFGLLLFDVGKHASQVNGGINLALEHTTPYLSSFVPYNFLAKELAAEFSKKDISGYGGGLIMLKTECSGLAVVFYEKGWVSPANEPTDNQILTAISKEDENSKSYIAEFKNAFKRLSFGPNTKNLMGMNIDVTKTYFKSNISLIKEILERKANIVFGIEEVMLTEGKNWKKTVVYVFMVPETTLQQTSPEPDLK